jgi:hypothetical protein
MSIYPSVFLPTPEQQLAAVELQISEIQAKLNSGVVDISESDRRVRYDMTTLKQQLKVLLDQRATLLPTSKPMIRRILTTSVKGL